MNTEETTIKPGAQFKHLGGIFTIGAMYPDGDIFYFKDQQDEIYEGRISTLKKMVKDGYYQMVKAAGLGIVARNPGGIEANSPAQRATPNPLNEPEPITVEALEKEGWEKQPEDHGSYSKGKVGVTFWLPGNDDDYLVGCLSERGYLSTYAKGVSSMQDLRTLESLVNGKTLKS